MLNKVYVQTCLMVKTITIKDSVFNRLSSQKGENESFSDLFERLLDNQISGIEILRKLRGSVKLIWLLLIPCIVFMILEKSNN